jgi:hypothetical protein
MLLTRQRTVLSINGEGILGFDVEILAGLDL